MKTTTSFKKLIQTKERFEKLSKGVIDYDKFNRYSIVHHGSSLEGSTLTEQETFVLLDNQLTPKNKPLEHTLMTVDHHKALLHVLDLAESKKSLTVEDIQIISSLILKNTGSEISAMAGNFDSSKGEFRKATVRTGNRTFMDYKKVPEKIKELLSFINSNIAKSTDFKSNSLLAFDVHFQMVSIHPFADGNGRLSRLLMNYVQHYQKQPLTIVFQEDKVNYFEALEKTREDEDIKVFHNFMFNQSYEYFNKEIANLTKEQKKSIPKDFGGLSFLF